MSATSFQCIECKPGAPYLTSDKKFCVHYLLPNCKTYAEKASTTYNELEVF